MLRLSDITEQKAKGDCCLLGFTSSKSKNWTSLLCCLLEDFEQNYLANMGLL